MKMLILKSTVLLFFSPGNSSDIGEVDNIHTSPDPPVGGANLTLYGDMILSRL